MDPTQLIGACLYLDIEMRKRKAKERYHLSKYNQIIFTFKIRLLFQHAQPKIIEHDNPTDPWCTCINMLQVKFSNIK